MPAMYEIKFLPEGKVLNFAGSRGNYYELADGNHIDVHTEPVWCRQCGKITHGEEIESQEEIDRTLAHLQERRAAMLSEAESERYPAVQDLGGRFSAAYIESMTRRSEWRKARKSPPRCVLCGSIEIVRLPPGEHVPHPDGSGWIELDVIGMCSTSFNEWFFMPEGDRIPRDTKPTYWYHPALDNSPGRRCGG
jgi:hypothetical protein